VLSGGEDFAVAAAVVLLKYNRELHPIYYKLDRWPLSKWSCDVVCVVVLVYDDVPILMISM
jgi:hypothetical protein